MRVPRKLGKQSKTHPHGDIGKRLRIAVLTPETRRLIAVDLVNSGTTDFQLVLALYSLGVSLHRQGVATRGQIGALKITLLIPWVYWFVHAEFLLGK
jgi:hypothetical protein